MQSCNRFERIKKCIRHIINHLNLIFVLSAYKSVLNTYGLEGSPMTEDDENSDVEVMEVINTKEYGKIIGE